MVDDDNATVVLTDVKAALAAADREAADSPPSLLAIGGGMNGAIFDLFPGELVIGRDPDNDIPLEIPGISRKHLRLKINEDYSKCILEDLGSRNGTFLNDDKITGSIELRKGDIIKIGSLALKFLPKGDPERATYEKLNTKAVTDGLTGCYNKAFLNSNAERHVQASKKSGAPLSMVLFDLDHFKHLNDNYGHDAGDFVLKELAKVIKENGLRESDIFARYGGEEFIVLMPNTNIKTGFEVAEKMRAAVANHQFIYDNKRLPVTASIGISDYRQGVNNGTDLFKRADQALYKSKEGGRNQVNFFKE